jgi:hypothetical protein
MKLTRIIEVTPRITLLNENIRHDFMRSQLCKIDFERRDFFEDLSHDFSIAEIKAKQKRNCGERFFIQVREKVQSIDRLSINCGDMARQ